MRRFEIKHIEGVRSLRARMKYLYTAGPVLIPLYKPSPPHDHPEPGAAYSQEATAAPTHDSEQAINAQLVDKQRGFTKRTLLGIKVACK